VNLNVLVKQFFNENNYNQLADRIAIVRPDGNIIYSNAKDSLESSSIGALVSGVWQAAESLNSIITNESQTYDFRLAFDTTENGLYILPIQIMGESYYVCSIFKDEVNPAKLKRNMRLLKENLEVFLSEYKEVINNRNDYLFSEITDEEMDNLFSFNRV
jgi:hypothetical protein